MSDLNLEEIEAKWLRQCGACDAGLGMSCSCPDGDPRNVIANLVDEVRRLRPLCLPPGGTPREVFAVETRGCRWPGFEVEAAAWEQLAKVKAWPDKPSVRIFRRTITEWPDGRLHHSPGEFVGGDPE